MADVNYSFPPQAGYTGIYRIKVYKLATDLEVATEDKISPHANPVTGSLFVATIEPYVVKVFAVGCDNKLVGTDLVYPDNGLCDPPAAIVFSDITNGTATASWTAPGSPPASYDWYLFEMIGGNLVSVSGGNVAIAEVDLTGLKKNTKYRLYVVSNCDGDGVSSEIHNDFTTTGPETNGTVELDSDDNVRVTIRSTTNQNEYGIDGEEGERSIPFDEYEIIEYAGTECPIDPPVNTLFTLDEDNDTFTITVACL